MNASSRSARLVAPEGWRAAALATLGSLAASLGFATLAQARRNARTPTLPANTPRPYDIQVHSFLGALAAQAPFDADSLTDSLDFIDRRFDCSDFLANSFIRALYAYPDRLDDYQAGLKNRIERTLLDFKYHWDQPGQDSLCTWSENHQILYAGLEYLAGAYFARPENGTPVFTNSGRPPEYHLERGRERVLAWIQRRFQFGFTEWYSNNYYLESIAAMSNIQEFAPDAAVSRAMEQALHLIYFDMATQSLRGSFLTTGGRMYENNKKSARTGSMLNRILADKFDLDIRDESEPFHEELTLMTKDMDLNVILNRKYQVPEAIRLIAHDQSPTVIKASQSIDIREGVRRRLFGPDDARLAAQWEMEAFTNYPVFGFTMAGLARNHMFSSEFFRPLKPLNLRALTPFYDTLSRVLNPFTNGKATQRANTYTYRTPHYLMATAQAYQPGGFSDQQHLFSALLNDDVAVFATHPSGELGATGALSKSPGYWVGNGRNPHAVQHLNRILAIYHLPKRKAVAEPAMHRFTHAYFPTDKMEEVVLADRQAFGRVGGTLVAVTAAQPFELVGTDELIQRGDQQYWVIECSDTGAETFAEFRQRVAATDIAFDGARLVYGDCQVDYRGEFRVAGVPQDLQYRRYDSKYCVGERESSRYLYAFGGAELTVAL